MSNELPSGTTKRGHIRHIFVGNTLGSTGVHKVDMRGEDRNPSEDTEDCLGESLSAR